MARTRRTIRRIALGAIGSAAAVLAIPTVASAVVYCVPNDAVDPSCTTGEGQATIQAALTAAQTSTGVADTVHIDTGSYSEAGLFYSSSSAGNTVIVEGEGTGLTLLTIPDTTGLVTGLTVTGPPGTGVRDLAMTIPANADASGDRGIDLGGSTTGQSLLVDGPSATNASGIRLFSSAAVVDSTVNLPFASPSNEAILSSSATSTISDLDLHANRGMRHIGTGTQTVDRASIEASTTGASLDVGAVVIRNSLIDLGTSNNAVGVQAANFNQSTSPMAATLEGVTIVGGGTNSTGVQAQADSDATPPLNEPGDTNTDGESSTVSVSNTILSGQTHSLRVEADRGETATMTTSHSNYDTSTKVVTSDLTAGGGTGTADLTETNQTNFAPGFVGGGDFHLAAGSDLIDIGDPAHPPGGELDIDGDAREIFGKDGCGARRDIGADEFVPLTPPTLLDCIPPDTSILSGPAGTITDNTPTFDFTSSEAPSTFQCSIDGAAFAPCSSPFTTPGLADGSHTFAVRAIDASSNIDPTAASRSFAIDATAPDTTVTGKRRFFTRKRKARVTETPASTEPGSTFECSVDSKPFFPCSSPFVIKLRLGKHLLAVRSTDALGNVDASPASFVIKVKPKPLPS